ncbi:MAG: hypothetical protein ACFFCW_00470 [Candidatus Hodarchaeota archaeon]
MAKSKNRLHLIVLLVVYSVVLLIPSTEDLAARDGFNIKITGMKLNREIFLPEDNLQLTYWLDNQGKLDTPFKMGIFIQGGPYGTWVKSWVLPLSLLKELEEGRPISQTLTVAIPPWGCGIYSVRIYADPENWLLEYDRVDNMIEKKIRVISPQQQISAASNILSRTIHPNGAVEIRFLDGSIKYRCQGKWAKRVTNGSFQIPAVGARSVAHLPPPTDQTTLDWLRYHSNELIEIIRDLVSGDTQAMSNYMNYENKLNEDRNVYESIYIRTQTIQDLLYPLVTK